MGKGEDGLNGKRGNELHGLDGKGGAYPIAPWRGQAEEGRYKGDCRLQICSPPHLAKGPDAKQRVLPEVLSPHHLRRPLQHVCNWPHDRLKRSLVEEGGQALRRRGPTRRALGQQSKRDKDRRTWGDQPARSRDRDRLPHCVRRHERVKLAHHAVEQRLLAEMLAALFLADLLAVAVELDGPLAQQHEGDAGVALPEDQLT